MLTEQVYSSKIILCNVIADGVNVDEIVSDLELADVTAFRNHKRFAVKNLGAQNTNGRLSVLVAYIRGEIEMPQKVLDYMRKHGLKSAVDD